MFAFTSETNQKRACHRPPSFSCPSCRGAALSPRPLVLGRPTFLALSLLLQLGPGHSVLEALCARGCELGSHVPVKRSVWSTCYEPACGNRIVSKLDLCSKSRFRTSLGDPAAQGLPSHLASPAGTGAQDTDSQPLWHGPLTSGPVTPSSFSSCPSSSFCCFVFVPPSPLSFDQLPTFLQGLILNVAFSRNLHDWVKCLGLTPILASYYAVV